MKPIQDLLHLKTSRARSFLCSFVIPFIRAKLTIYRRTIFKDNQQLSLRYWFSCGRREGDGCTSSFTSSRYRSILSIFARCTQLWIHMNMTTTARSSQLVDSIDQIINSYLYESVFIKWTVSGASVVGADIIDFSPKFDSRWGNATVQEATTIDQRINIDRLLPALGRSCSGSHQ